jgi:hypothetical protein
MATSPFSFANIFRPTQQVTQAPQQQATPPQQPGPAAPMQQGSFEPPKPVSPLDQFKDLWNTAPNADPNGSADPFTQPLFSSDPAKIREAASQIDFLQAVPQEVMQKAMSGNDPQAFMSVMNAVAQNALATALQVGTQTVEQAGTKLGERFNKALPTKFRDLQINAAPPSNPILSHPAAQPMVSMVKNQIKMTNPEATPDQVNKMAEDYLAGLASALSGPADGATANKEESSGQNWMDWVSPQAR